MIMSEYKVLHQIVWVQDIRNEQHKPESEGIANMSAKDGWHLCETIVTQLNNEELLFTFVMEREVIKTG